MNPDTNAKIALGFLIPNILSIALLTITKYIGEVTYDTTNVLVFSNFILIPILMGIVSAYFWRDLSMKTSKYILWSLYNTGIAIATSAIVLREGVVCLAIVSPLILAFMIVGVLTGKKMFKQKNNLLKANVIGVLFLLFIVDHFSAHQNLSMVSDTLIVNAPIEKVWPLVVAYEPITVKEDYWLFKIGMPSPVQSTVDGYKVGANRKCIFSNGYVFDEKITVFKPNEELTFEITEQPRDPEIMGHIDIIRGQFILKDNGNGTTTLIGNSWYKLYVFPDWYFGVWAKSITRNVHIRVMEHIKLLSEKNV
jgi:hypothetical protein